MFESIKRFFQSKHSGAGENYKSQADGINPEKKVQQYKQEQGGGSENFTANSDAPGYHHLHQNPLPKEKETLADEMPIDTGNQFKEPGSIPFKKRDKDEDSVPPNP